MKITDRLFIILTIAVFFGGCKKSDTVAPTTRSYRMGFQNSAPRYNDFNLVLQTLALWADRADAAMITTEVPWDSLLAGKTPQEYVANNYVGLVNYYKGKNMKLWVYIDPANGLNRASDANALVAAGKSIAQPDVQKMYRRFVVVMDSMLKPDHLGLALETNLIRFASPSSIYQGVKQAAAAAAQDVRAIDKTVKISVSIQADVAWGKLQKTNTYEGIAQDMSDFPFIEELGISSYPYFNYSKPGDIPDDYYSRLQTDSSLPLFVSEGGWSSVKADPSMQCDCSAQQQSDYVTKQSQLLDKANAIGWFQLAFTDIDIASLPSTTDPTLKYFAYIGLVDTQLQPKASLSVWDGVFERGLR